MMLCAGPPTHLTIPLNNMGQILLLLLSVLLMALPTMGQGVVPPEAVVEPQYYIQEYRVQG